MGRRLAQGLTIALFVGLGAAQRPAKFQRSDRATVSGNVGAPAVAARPNPYQVGTASWYGEYFEGKPTASGEPYNMYELTAAHPTLPLGTMVRVTNLRNRQAVIVRINDRGPVVPRRIIDVSYSAARILQFQTQGLQRVRLDLVPPRAAATMALLRDPRF